MDANFFQLQDVGPDFYQQRFGWGLRLYIYFGQIGPAPVRRRQCSPVDLSIGGQWKRLQPDKGGGNHVVRKLRANIAAKLPHSEIFLGSEVCHQPLVCGEFDGLRLSRIFQSQNQCLSHLRVPAKYRLDFAQLNAKTANLDLMVDASEEFKASIRQVARQIPSPV